VYFHASQTVNGQYGLLKAFKYKFEWFFELLFALENFFGKFCKKLGKFHHNLLETLRPVFRDFILGRNNISLPKMALSKPVFEVYDTHVHLAQLVTSMGENFCHYIFLTYVATMVL